MKNLTLAILFVATTFLSFGQISHDLEIFSEDGLKFTLILNGRVLNEEPMSNVQILNMDKDYVSAKIKFENGDIEDIVKKNLQIANPTTDEASRNKPVTTVYKIVEKKGNYKLRFASRSDKKIQPKENVIVQQNASTESSKVKIVINW